MTKLYAAIPALVPRTAAPTPPRPSCQRGRRASTRERQNSVSPTIHLASLKFFLVTKEETLALSNLFEHTRGCLNDIRKS